MRDGEPDEWWTPWSPRNDKESSEIDLSRMNEWTWTKEAKKKNAGKWREKNGWEEERWT